MVVGNRASSVVAPQLTPLLVDRRTFGQQFATELDYHCFDYGDDDVGEDAARIDGGVEGEDDELKINYWLVDWTNTGSIFRIKPTPSLHLWPIVGRSTGGRAGRPKDA